MNSPSKINKVNQIRVLEKRKEKNWSDMTFRYYIGCSMCLSPMILFRRLEITKQGLCCTSTKVPRFLAFADSNAYRDLQTVNNKILKYLSARTLLGAGKDGLFRR